MKSLWLRFVLLPLMSGSACYPLRTLVHPSTPVARTVMGSLPDALWAFAFGAAIALATRTALRNTARAWGLLAFLVAIAVSLASHKAVAPSR